MAITCAISIPEAAAQYVCGQCNGSGKVQKYSNVSHRYETRTCTNCNGTGRVRSNPDADIDWKAYLNPQELQAVLYLEQAMREPYYVITPCQACSGTGKCPTCHGLGVVTLDSDGCWVCGGTGMCIGCRGVGSHSHVAENPNLNNMRQQWAQYMKIGYERKRKQSQ